MIRLEHVDDQSRKFVLRGIRLRDELVLAEIMSDRADDGTGPYTTAIARVHCNILVQQNNSFPGLPIAGLVPVTLTWMLDVDGETVAFVKIGYLGTHAHLVNLNVHPDERGKGYAKTIAMMFMRNIGHLGEETVSFESMESSPAVVAIAENYLDLRPGEQRVGFTGQTLTKYEFQTPDMQERLIDPKNSDQAIPVAIVEAGEVKVEAVDIRPKVDVEASPEPKTP